MGTTAVRVATTVAELSELRDELATASPCPTVSFVPTLGALHAGHRSLFRIARNVGDVVVVSIFVNPLQFGPDEDYARYPRVLDDDLEVCRQEGVDIVFVPRVIELYPAGRHVTLCSGPLGAVVEGASRPRHFDGVLTVMAKLFNIVRPDKAIFGETDPQQLVLVRKMVSDLNYDLDIVSGPIVRDEDGLALSTRNRYLLPHERTSALALSAALRSAARQETLGGALAAARSLMELAEVDGALRLDYLSLVNPLSFTEVSGDHDGDALLVVAAWIGDTRLTDSIELAVTTRSLPFDDLIFGELNGPGLDADGHWHPGSRSSHESLRVEAPASR